MPAELELWIQQVCVKRRLWCLSFNKDRPFGEVLSSVTQGAIQRGVRNLFLFPANSMPTERLCIGDIKARPWGWVCVRPGPLLCDEDSNVLIMSELHGEMDERGSRQAIMTIDSIKRRIRPEARAGVLGYNLSTGCQSVYRDIRYTNQAAEQYKSGGLWKQYIKGPVVFRPHEL